MAIQLANGGWLAWLATGPSASGLWWAVVGLCGRDALAVAPVYVLRCCRACLYLRRLRGEHLRFIRRAETPDGQRLPVMR